MRMRDFILEHQHRMIGAPVDGFRLRAEAIAACYAEFRALHAAEIEAEAARLVEARMNGPRTHRYRGVGVTEEQFWALLKAEGFELPGRQPESRGLLG